MDTILGIDLGTTNSVVAAIRDGKVEVLEEDGQKLIPSVVGLDAEGRLLVGAAAQNQWVLAPDRTVRSIKRLMGSDESGTLAACRHTAVSCGNRLQIGLAVASSVPPAMVS